MTENMMYSRDIKEEVEEPEDIGMHIEKYKFTYDWQQNGKTDVKSVTDMDSLSFEGSCDREDDKQKAVKLNNFMNQMNCKHEHMECTEIHSEGKCDSEIVNMEMELPEDIKIEKEKCKLSYACLKIEETEDKEDIFVCGRSSSKSDCGSEDSNQLNGDDSRKYDATEGIYNQEIQTKVTCDSDIVKLKMDCPEEFEIDTEEHELNYTCLEIGKIDVESMFPSDNSTIVVAKTNSKPVNTKLDDTGNNYIVEWYKCQHCEYKTKTKLYLNRHFKRKHDDGAKWYKCQHCEFKTKRICDLKRHFIRKHDDCAEWYKCQHCEFKTKEKYYLKEHFKLKHDDSAEWYRCEHCEFETKDKYNLKHHFKSKHDGNPEWYKCQRCEFKTKRKYYLHEHFKLKHDDSAEWYKCEHCEFKTKSRDILKQHLKRSHGDSAEWYKCEHCEFKTKYKNTLNKHFKVKHDDSSEWYKCHYCEFETKDIKYLKKHFVWKHDNTAEWYKCEHCEFKTKRRYYLNEHFNRKHDDAAELYKCEHCEFETKGKYKLKRHFKLKHDDGITELVQRRGFTFHIKTAQ